MAGGREEQVGLGGDAETGGGQDEGDLGLAGGLVDEVVEAYEGKEAADAVRRIRDERGHRPM